tara:strand:+ start:155 stop:277 length:123 start_codon:yes stop_codon:yes gene_type:complete
VEVVVVTLKMMEQLEDQLEVMDMDKHLQLQGLEMQVILVE